MKPILFLFCALLAHAQADPDGQRAKLEQLSRALDDKSFANREVASQELKKLTTAEMPKAVALQHLKDLWQASENPEVRARLFTLARDLYLPTKGSMFGFRFMADKYLDINGQRTICLNVNDVVDSSPAMKGGIQANDLIYGVNEHILGTNRSLEDLMALFRRLSPEKTHELRIRRQEKDLILKIRPDEQPLLPDDRTHFKKAFQTWLLAKKEAPSDKTE